MFKLHNMIFAGIGLGLLLGLALNALDHDTAFFTTILWWLDLFGRTIFIGALKMIIAPLILASIVSGIVSLRHLGDLGRIGWRIMAYYFCTTALAVGLGLVFVLILQPGRQASSMILRQEREKKIAAYQKQYEQDKQALAVADGEYTPAFREWLWEQESQSQAGSTETSRWQKISRAKKRTPGTMFRDNIIMPLLENPFSALTGTNSLGIIFFALLLGIAIVSVGREGEHAARFFQGMNAAIMKVTTWIMKLSPFCVMCIVAGLMAEHGFTVFASLSWYCLTVILGIAVHVALLFAIAWLLGRTKPLALWRGIEEAWLIAFSTRSSAATLPVTLRCTTDKLKVSPQVANFSLPVGATMNMDGTALYEGVAVIFLLQMYSGLADVPVVLGGMTTLVVFITAVLASIGAAAVPDAGLVTMVLVANAVGLPVYYIPILFAVDAFLDMFRTSTNVLGDTVGCVVVNYFEKTSETKT